MTMRYKQNGLIEALNGLFDMTTVKLLRFVLIFVFNYCIISWKMRGGQDVVVLALSLLLSFFHHQQQQEEEQEVRVSQLFNTL